MTIEEALQILKPFKKCMFDQYGCPISDAAIALDVAINALSADARHTEEQAYMDGYAAGRQALYKDICELMGHA